MDVWEPIETAPKDAGELLLRNGAIRWIGEWSEDHGAWVDYGAAGLIYGVQPTHWLPLP